jgi:hypothetical protein
MIGIGGNGKNDNGLFNICDSDNSDDSNDSSVID